MIPIWVGFQRQRVDDVFVVDNLVRFVIREGEYLIGFWVPNNLMTLDDLSGSGFLEWFSKFIQYILFFSVFFNPFFLLNAITYTYTYCYILFLTYSSTHLLYLHISTIFTHSFTYTYTDATVTRKKLNTSLHLGKK